MWTIIVTMVVAAMVVAVVVWRARQPRLGRGIRIGRPNVAQVQLAGCLNLSDATVPSVPRFSGATMATIVFRCPDTGLQIQGSIAEDPICFDDQSYETVSCSACGQIHLVNPKTGKVIGEDDGR